MAFGMDSKPSRIWSFGAGEPTENLDLVLEQIRLAGVYRNRLVELERQRRDESYAVLVARIPHLVEMEEAAHTAQAALDAAKSEAKLLNSAERRRRITPEERERIAALKTASREAWAALKTARRDAYADPRVISSLEVIEEHHRERCREARAASGVFWGTYLKIEDSVKDIRKGPPPTFRSNRGEGRVVMQLQAGKNKPAMTPVDAIAGTDLRFRIHRDRVCPNGKVRATARLRIGTVEGTRTPIWTTFPVVLHREFPADAKIKWVWLRRTREHGTHWRWDLQVTLARDNWDDPRRATNGETVGVDLGWYWNGETLRVAAWVGSDDERGTVDISAKDTARWRKVEELRSIRDRMFNDARDYLVGWMSGRELPEWFRERTTHLHQWRSPRRLAALVLHWRDHRFDGDEEAYWRLEGRRVEVGTRVTGKGPMPIYQYVGWRKQDRHLYNWERANEEKACRWRDNLFRNLVRELSCRYQHANIEAKFVAKLAKKPDVDEEGPEFDTGRRRVIASPGRVAELIVEVFGKENVKRVPPEFTTQRCCYCGRMDAFDAARERVRTCRHCGEREDQDYRAAINLLNASGDVVDESVAPARGV